MYNMYLEDCVIPDSKKAIKDSGAHIKKLPLAKDGTMWAPSWVIISIDWNTANMFKSMSSYWYLEKVNNHLLRMEGTNSLFWTLNKVKESSIYLAFLIYTVPLGNKLLDKGFISYKSILNNKWKEDKTWIRISPFLNTQYFEHQWLITTQIIMCFLI